MAKRTFLLSLSWLFFMASGRSQLTVTFDYFAIGKKAQASQNYPLAIENFKKAAVQDPSSAQAWYELGCCYYKTKNFQPAKWNFQKCLEVSTTTGRSGGVIHDRNCPCGGTEYLECTECDIFGYEQLYYPEKKKVLCRTCAGTRHVECPYGKYVAPQAASLKKYGIESYRQLADISFEEEDYSLSELYYDRFIRENGENGVESKIWHNLGYSEYRMERYKNAVSSFNKAIRLDPKNGSTYLELAHAYFSLESNDEALDNFRLAVKLDPKLKAESLAGIGGVYYVNLKNYDSAIYYFERSLLLEKDWLGYYQLGWCYNDKERYTDAVKALKQSIQLVPDNDDSHTELACAYYELAQYDAALAQCIPIMKKNAENESSRYYAGLVYAKKNDQKNLKKMINELNVLKSTEYAEELTGLLK